MTDGWDEQIEDLQRRLGALIDLPGLDDEGRAVALETLEELTVVVEELHAQSSELQASHRDLERQHDRYRELFDNAPAGYLVTDADGIVSEVNATALGLFGETLSRMRGRPLARYIEAADLGAFYNHLARISHSAMGYHIFVNLSIRDHPFIPVALRATVTGSVGGRTDEIRWLLQDRRGEIRTADLREEEERLRGVFEMAPVGIMLCDGDGEVLFANAHARDLLGAAQPDEVPGPVVLATHPDDRAPVAAAYDTARRGGEVTQLRHRLSVGDQVRWVDHAIAPFRDSRGGIQGHISTLNDVTRTVELEGQLAQTTRLESVGRLAAGVAHDVANALTLLQLRIDRLGERHHDQASVADVAAVARTLDRTKDLIADLLAFSRRQPLVPASIDLNGELSRLLDSLQGVMSDTVTIQVEFDPARPTVFVDPARFDHLVTNLVFNARDAIGTGGGTITVSTATEVVGPTPPDRPPSHLAPGTYGRLTVADSGSGIAAADLPHVFDPYFTTKPVGRGVGLGLATAYGTVSQSGGDITVTSSPGAGAVFAVWLPAGPPAGGHSPTILVVEDEPELRETLVDLLADAGFDTLGAGSGQDALRHLDRPVGMLVTDVFLPGIDGPRVASRFRERHAGLPILFISGADEVTVRRMVPEGAPVLRKPFRDEELLEAVRRQLAGNEA